jgi:hypothetical protein
MVRSASYIDRPVTARLIARKQTHERLTGAHDRIKLQRHSHHFTEQDRFGFDPLAKAIARSIANIPEPEGVVFAINGPWGAGKSSVLNLVTHYFKYQLNCVAYRFDDRKEWFLKQLDDAGKKVRTTRGCTPGPCVHDRTGATAR